MSEIMSSFLRYYTTRSVQITCSVHTTGSMHTTAEAFWFVWALDKEERPLTTTTLDKRFPLVHDVQFSKYKNLDVKSNAFAEIAKLLDCSKYYFVSLVPKHQIRRRSKLRHPRKNFKKAKRMSGLVMLAAYITAPMAARYGVELREFGFRGKFITFRRE